MMTNILENIISLRKELVDVSVEPFGFVGYIDSASEEFINILRQFTKPYLRECFYVSSNNDVDIENVKLDEKICIKINLSDISNYYNTTSEFVNANKNELKHSTFYIHEIDYFEGKSDKNKIIENYKTNIEIITFLKEISDYNKLVAGDLELFFYRAEKGITFSVDYTWNQIPKDLSEISSKIKDLQSQLIASADAQERKQIFINELISILNKKGNSYIALLENIKTLIANYKKSFDLYLSGFSFDKIKTASVEYFHELTDRIHSTILKYSTYIFAIPVAYIFLIRFLDFSGDSILKDSFLILLGILFFILIWFVLFKSVDEAISSVEKDIISFKEKLGTDNKLEPIKEELNIQQNHILPKQRKRLLLVKILTILILLSSIIAFSLIHFNYLKSLINVKKVKIEKNDINKNGNTFQPEIDTLNNFEPDSTLNEINRNTTEIKATAKAIHICNSHEPTLNQKLQKSMSYQRTERQTERRKHIPPTMYISHWAIGG